VPPAKMAVLSGVRVGGISGDSPSTDDPSALPMSVGAAWFPLLPVATPGLLNATSASVRAARVGDTLTDKSKVQFIKLLYSFQLICENYKIFRTKESHLAARQKVKTVPVIYLCGLVLQHCLEQWQARSGLVVLHNYSYKHFVIHCKL